jgi:hypothetical protein
MRALLRTLAAVCAVIAFAAALPAADDLTIVSKTSDNDEAPTTGTSYYASDRMRVANPDGSEVMAEYGSGQITTIDHDKKQYSVITRQEMEAAAQKMQAQLKQMEEQMKNMPPAVREKMAGMMGGATAAINAQKGQGGRTVAGYTCENWIVTVGEIVKQEQCLTTQLEFPGQPWEALKGLAGGMSGPMGKTMEQMYEKFKEMKGVPLYTSATTKILAKSITSTTEVVEVKKGPIPASAWTIPAGYKKVESPMAKMAK